MAWRYKQFKPESGDTVYPRDWELNNQEMASEFNGYLDRDNFREEAFSADRSLEDNAPLVAHNAFNQFFKNQFNSEYCSQFTTFDNDSSGWHSLGFENATQTNQEYARTTIDLKSEALLSIEFSCHFEWNPSDRLKGTDHNWVPFDTNSEPTGIATPEHPDNELHYLCVAIDYQGNGNTNLQNGYGFFKSTGSHGSINATYDGTAIHESSVYQDTKLLRSDTVETREAFVVGPNVLYGACAFRVVVDGTTVCESGWFSDHRKKENVYLVGAVPVDAGLHEVVVEVRKAFVSNDEPGIFTLNLKKPVVMYDRELIIHARYR
jgi:hypothetical protein